MTARNTSLSPKFPKRGSDASIMIGLLISSADSAMPNWFWRDAAIAITR
jgi:hypothetical protein